MYNKICSIVATLFSDQVIFPLFEILLFIIFLYASAKEYRWFTKEASIYGAVKRGEKSWNHFYLAYGVASVVLLQVINSSEALKGYKIIISLINLFILFYLAFFNSWFRNKIIGVIIKSQEKYDNADIK